MHSTAHCIRPQEQRLKSRRRQCSHYEMFNVLTNDELLDEVESLLPAHRERLYPPTETLALFLNQVMNADSSCQQTVNQSSIQRLVDGLPVTSARTGGYCRARQRLPMAMPASLARFTGQMIDRKTPDAWRWQGRRVRIVDGTTVSMPDTAANQAVYPQSSNQQPGLGFPLCRIVGITCLASGALLNAATSATRGKGSDEQTLLRSMQDSFAEGDIVLGDAFYATFFFIAQMQARGVDILMEQYGIRRRSTDFRRGKKLGSQDHLICLKKPVKRPDWMSEVDYAEAPDTITVRELKVGHRILVTTLFEATMFSKEALGALYKSRWHVELDIRHIKETMAMDKLRCKTPAMIEKEVWVYLLAYNLLRYLMAQSALLADILPRAISFKHCLQLWGSVNTLMRRPDEAQWLALLMLIAQQQVGNRPGRVEPRAVKRRPKPYPLLMKKRHQAQQDIRKWGHPKKLK